MNAVRMPTPNSPFTPASASYWSFGKYTERQTTDGLTSSQPISTHQVIPSVRATVIPSVKVISKQKPDIMPLKRKDLILHWEAPDTQIENLLWKKVFHSLSGTGDTSQVWLDCLAEHLQFPFCVYVKEPSFTPGTVRFARILVKELANPPYSSGGNVVVIGSLSSSPDQYAYYFLYDFASVEADEGTFQAIQAYHYWHYSLQRATFLP
jgi:hypothetical protein